MMNSIKLTLLIFLFLTWGISYSQLIRVSEKDKFENKQRIETRGAVLGMGIASRIAYRSIGNTIFLNFLTTGSYVVGSEHALIFLLENEEQVKVYSKGIQTSKYSGKFFYSDFEYRISDEEVSILAREKITSIRAYTSDGYYDVDVGKKHSEKINELSRVFLAEYSKYYSH